MANHRFQPPGIQRQIVLPISKAVEIAYKSIRLRLSRSLLVISGIVLALAFLVSILTSQKLLDGMRQWEGQINQRRAHLAAATGANRPAADLALLADADRLQRILASHGVAASAADARADRIQTRWLLGLALLVAFVGILNSMLMSVTERFREIGTMKCLGALDSFIIKLFLIESLFQGFVGTVLGIVLGLALSFLAALSSYGSYVFKNLPLAAIGGNVLICLAAGVALTVAGALYPAWKAARLQRIEAMRVET